MKIDPVPEGKDATESTNARGINQLHVCLEDEKKKAARHRRDLTLRVKNLAKALGDPGDEPAPAANDDTLFGRLKRVERSQHRAAVWWDRGRVALATCGVLLPAFGAILWWLEGAKIARLLGIP